MPEAPQVSVVMSVYNGADVLPETIESVLQQNYKDFEFIIVNDGSTEKQVQGLLESYSRSEKRIKVLQQPNKGLTQALIRGCKQARGQYIARIDAGDRMLPDRLFLQSRILQQHANCSFVSSHVDFMGPEWEWLWCTKGKPDSEYPVDVVDPCPDRGLAADIPHHGSVTFRRSDYERVGGYRHQFYYGQDWDLWYRLAEVGKYYVVPIVLYQARLFPQSISMSHSCLQETIAKCSLGAHLARKRLETEKEWLEKAVKIRSGMDEYESAKKTNGYYFIGEALRRSHNIGCRRYFVNAIKSDPKLMRCYIRFIQSFSIVDK